MKTIGLFALFLLLIPSFSLAEQLTRRGTRGSTQKVSSPRCTGVEQGFQSHMLSVIAEAKEQTQTSVKCLSKGVAANTPACKERRESFVRNLKKYRRLKRKFNTRLAFTWAKGDDQGTGTGSSRGPIGVAPELRQKCLSYNRKGRKRAVQMKNNVNIIQERKGGPRACRLVYDLWNSGLAEFQKPYLNGDKPLAGIPKKEVQFLKQFEDSSLGRSIDDRSKFGKNTSDEDLRLSLYKGFQNLENGIKAFDKKIKKLGKDDRYELYSFKDQYAKFLGTLPVPARANAVKCAADNSFLQDCFKNNSAEKDGRCGRRLGKVAVSFLPVVGLLEAIRGSKELVGASAAGAVSSEERDSLATGLAVQFFFGLAELPGAGAAVGAAAKGAARAGKIIARATEDAIQGAAAAVARRRAAREGARAAPAQGAATGGARRLSPAEYSAEIVKNSSLSDSQRRVEAARVLGLDPSDARNDAILDAVIKAHNKKILIGKTKALKDAGLKRDQIQELFDRGVAGSLDNTTTIKGVEDGFPDALRGDTDAWRAGEEFMHDAASSRAKLLHESSRAPSERELGEAVESYAQTGRILELTDTVGEKQLINATNYDQYVGDLTSQIDELKAFASSKTGDAQRLQHRKILRLMEARKQLSDRFDQPLNSRRRQFESDLAEGQKFHSGQWSEGIESHKPRYQAIEEAQKRFEADIASARNSGDKITNMAYAGKTDEILADGDLVNKDNALNVLEDLKSEVAEYMEMGKKSHVVEHKIRGLLEARKAVADSFSQNSAVKDAAAKESDNYELYFKTKYSTD